MTRFYAANVLCALEYMHQYSIAYRDLKPENLLIDSSGYIKLCDLGFAKVIEGRSCTFCGTPDYMAPEFLQYKAHDLSVDVWAFGVILFEMSVGTTPFDQESMQDIFLRILDYHRGHFKLPFPIFDWT